MQSAPPTSKSEAVRELDWIPKVAAGMNGDSTNALARTTLRDKWLAWQWGKEESKMGAGLPQWILARRKKAWTRAAV